MPRFSRPLPTMLSCRPNRPVAPPMTPSSPINEPEPDRLPDETPVPNPDEYDRPAKIMILRCHSR